MSIFWKALGIFLIIWIVWYLTGGPKRTTNVKPYLEYDFDTNSINKSNSNLETGAKDMFPVDTAQEGAQIIKDNLQNQSMAQQNN